MKSLNDLWILTDTGAVVFKKNGESVANEQFFGMILSVINTFAEQLATGGLSSFELGPKRFYMAQKNNFIFIGSALLKNKDKNAKKELQEIIKLFFKTFPEDIADKWGGNLSLFSDFENIIDKK